MWGCARAYLLVLRVLLQRRAPGLLCDAEKMGNEARFINDFHGTSKNPNVRFERRVDEVSGEVRLGIHVQKRKIRKGEELLITYGHCYAFG
jgi:hypothetical protein